MEAEPFSNFIQKLKDGAVNDELSHSLQALVAAVGVQQKSGKLVLTITVKPNKGDGQVFVAEDISLQEPKPTRAVSLFFVDKESNLTRDNPRQMTMQEQFTQLKKDESEVENERK